MHLLFPVGGALLALTTALAAACFVKAFGMTFVALPESFGGGRDGIVNGDARAAGVAGRVLCRARRVSGIRAPRARGGDGLHAWSAAATGPSGVA